MLPLIKAAIRHARRLDPRLSSQRCPTHNPLQVTSRLKPNVRQPKRRALHKARGAAGTRKPVSYPVVGYSAQKDPRTDAWAHGRASIGAPQDGQSQARRRRAMRKGFMSERDLNPCACELRI
jgi:hypothetical protein